MPMAEWGSIMAASKKGIMGIARLPTPLGPPPLKEILSLGVIGLKDLGFKVVQFRVLGS